MFAKPVSDRLFYKTFVWIHKWAKGIVLWRGCFGKNEKMEMFLERVWARLQIETLWHHWKIKNSLCKKKNNIWLFFYKKDLMWWDLVGWWQTNLETVRVRIHDAFQCDHPLWNFQYGFQHRTRDLPNCCLCEWNNFDFKHLATADWWLRLCIDVS